jgi:FixJ family two-component response regulator
MTHPRAIYLIDDDEAVLDSLGCYLGSRGFEVQRFLRADRALEALQRGERPKCVVSDIRLPGVSGLELQSAFASLPNAPPLILITGHGDIDMAVSAIKAGAHDFLEKPFNEKRLATAIETAIATGDQKTREAGDILELVKRRGELSERQLQVMDAAARGQTNKEIGAALGISPRTVEIYRAKVMERMGATTLAELVRIVVRLERAR